MLTEVPEQENYNPLFPVFLKLRELHLLVVGGGFVALEKIEAVLANSRGARITVVAMEIKREIMELAAVNPNVELEQKPYEAADLQGKEVVIVAVNDIPTSEVIRKDAKKRGLLVNVADKPALCDFYLGSVVRKGNLKIAISTNGKSPTIAKRIKEMLNDVLPEEVDELLENMQVIRNRLKGDFAHKVETLNELTRDMVDKKGDCPPKRTGWQTVVLGLVFAFFFMIVGHAFFTYIVPFHVFYRFFTTMTYTMDLQNFGLMCSAGFLAQMVDGSLGLGYGTISTTFLLAMGVNPALVSSRVHSARVFSSGVSGYSHKKFGNVNKKLFRALAMPGIVGAILGALLAVVAKNYALYVRIPLSIYAIYLGYYIIQKAFKQRKQVDKVKGAGWLAATGGFLDAFAGGGWGALVTSTLIAKRKDARYVIGSVCLAEFFVVFSSATTFFILLNHIPVLEVLGLILGGIVAAPIAARLAGKLPKEKMLVGVGAVVILTNLTTLWRAVSQLMHIH